MKIIFTQDVRGKGKRGEVKEIPDGYANFLIKSNKAKQADAAAMSQLRGQKRAEEKKEAEELQKAMDESSKPLTPEEYNSLFDDDPFNMFS